MMVNRKCMNIIPSLHHLPDKKLFWMSLGMLPSILPESRAGPCHPVIVEDQYAKN